MLSPETLLSFSKVLFLVGLVLTGLSSLGITRYSALITKTKSEQLARTSAQAERLQKIISDYQLDIATKNETIQKLEVENIKQELAAARYEFSGIKRRIVGTQTYEDEQGEEPLIFAELKELEKEERYPEMIELTTLQISKTPDWLTPYLFRGAAYFNLGQNIKALADFEYVVKQAIDDPAYEVANQILEKIRPKSTINQAAL